MKDFCIITDTSPSIHLSSKESAKVDNTETKIINISHFAFSIEHIQL